MTSGVRGYTGNGIVNISKTGTSGLVDTYTITYTDGNTTTFTVTNARSISNIAKTNTNGLIDVYTITYNDGTTSTFDVTNGKGISSITKTGSAGLIDNYRITYNDGTYFDYIVTNGQDGEVTEEELQDIFEQMSSEMENGTGTGTSIDATDSAYWKAKLQPKGNIFQQTYEGYNLLRYPYYNSSKSVGNITFTVNSDGSVRVVGTKTTDEAIFYFRLTDFSLNIDENETYTLVASGLINGKVHIDTYNSDWGDFLGSYALSANSYHKTGTATNADINPIIRINVSSNEQIDTTVKLWLYKGEYNSSKLYEPYVGGTTSPNPDYPQEIQVLKGENNVKIQDKNYLDISKCVMGANNTNVNTTVTYSTKTNRACTKFDVNPIYVKANTSYTIKKDTYYFSVAQLNSNNIVINDSGWKSADYTFTTNTNCEKIVLNFKKSNDVNFDIDDFKQQQIQVEENSTATQFVPHQEQNYPITLPEGMELCKIGNYKDYIYKNIVDGNWYKHSEIGSVDLANLTWTGSGLWACNTLDNIKYTSSNTQMGVGLAEKYIMHIGSGMSTATNCIAIDTDAIRVKTTSYEIKPSGIFKYALATPTETKITDTTLINQLNDLDKKLKTYQGVTHITQTNEDMPFILTLDYKKSNLLRIQALENANS